MSEQLSNSTIRTGLDQIQARIAPGWPSVVEVEAGWWPLLVELDGALSQLEPAYEVYRIGEKFGVLRYYCSAASPEAQRLIGAVERASSVTCEVCGGPGNLVRVDGWHQTRCSAHTRPGSDQ
jgi:hypothetical protein